MLSSNQNRTHVIEKSLTHQSDPCLRPELAEGFAFVLHITGSAPQHLVLLLQKPVLAAASVVLEV